MFFKVVAGVLSTLALATGTVMAIPESREFILNTIAPYSEVYEQQVDKNADLESAYNTNLETLNKTRDALAKAEQQSLAFQTNLSTAQSNLLTAQNDLNTNISQLNVLQTNYDNAQIQISNLQMSLDNANFNIMQLNNDLSNLNNQYMILQMQYNEAIMNGNQALIDDLNRQISDLIMERENLNMQLNDKQMEVDNLYMQLDMERMDRDYYEMRIMDMQMEIDMLNNDIMMRNDEVMQLQVQVNDQQMTIDQLNQEIIRLNNIQIELEDGSIVFDKFITEMLIPMYSSDGTLYSFLCDNNVEKENSRGDIIIDAYLQQCKNNSEKINELLGDNNPQIRIHTGDMYQVMISTTLAYVEINGRDYMFNSDIQMNVKYSLNGIEMTSDDLITSIDRDTSYNRSMQYSYSLDDNSRITSITCNFRVMDIE